MSLQSSKIFCSQTNVLRRLSYSWTLPFFISLFSFNQSSHVQKKTLKQIVSLRTSWKESPRSYLHIYGFPYNFLLYVCTKVILCIFCTFCKQIIIGIGYETGHSVPQLILCIRILGITKEPPYGHSAVCCPESKGSRPSCHVYTLVLLSVHKINKLLKQNHVDRGNIKTLIPNNLFVHVTGIRQSHTAAPHPHPPNSAIMEIRTEFRLGGSSMELLDLTCNIAVKVDFPWYRQNWVPDFPFLNGEFPFSEHKILIFLSAEFPFSERRISIFWTQNFLFLNAEFWKVWLDADKLFPAIACNWTKHLSLVWWNCCLGHWVVYVEFSTTVGASGHCKIECIIDSFDMDHCHLVESNVCYSLCPTTYIIFKSMCWVLHVFLYIYMRCVHMVFWGTWGRN